MRGKCDTLGREKTRCTSELYSVTDTGMIKKAASSKWRQEAILIEEWIEVNTHLRKIAPHATQTETRHIHW